MEEEHESRQEESPEMIEMNINQFIAAARQYFFESLPAVAQVSQEA